MSRILPRFHRHQTTIEDQRKIGRILLEAAPTSEPVKTVTRATLPGDRRRLRGIPVVGGVSGTSPGTDPQSEALRAIRPARYPHN